MKSESRHQLCFSRRSSKGSSQVTLLCASVHPSICPKPQDLPIIDFIQGCHVSNLSRRNTVTAIWSGKFVAMFQSSGGFMAQLCVLSVSALCSSGNSFDRHK